MKQKTRLNLILFFVLFFLFLNKLVFALEVNYPRVPGATPPQDFVNSASQEEFLALYVKYVFVLIIWISGIIFFGSLLYAGFLYLTSAGSVDKIIRAREQVLSSFLGILLLFSCILILNTLGPQFTPSEITPPPKIQPAEEITVPSFVEENYQSVIMTELPLGYLIQEKIFEGVIDPTDEKRIPRIKDNALTTLAIVNNIKNNIDIEDENSDDDDDLRKAVEDCKCKNATPQCYRLDSCRECDLCYYCENCPSTINIGCGNPYLDLSSLLSNPEFLSLFSSILNDNQIINCLADKDEPLFTLDPWCKECKPPPDVPDNNCYDCYCVDNGVAGCKHDAVPQCKNCVIRCGQCPRTLNLEKLRRCGVPDEITERLTCAPCENCLTCHSCSGGHVCTGGAPCSSDPCKKSRSKIEKFINQNLKEIGRLKEEKNPQKPGEKPKLSPEKPLNLIEEMEKSLKEAKELRAELKRLEELKNFMENTCPPHLLKSYSANTAEQKFYNHKNWPFLISKFFDDINLGTISAYKKSLRYSTFYCVTSGTVIGHPGYSSYQEALFDLDFLDPEAEDELIESLSEELSHCYAEVPVGEFIETAKKLGEKLAERLETLAELDQKLISAVDKLHILISQCSSRNCTSICKKHFHQGHYDYCIEKCGKKGENPCPKEIPDQIDTINSIVAQIREVVKEGDTPGTEISVPGESLKDQKIGILAITNKILPAYLFDFDATVRTYMETCYVPYYEGEPYAEKIHALVACQSTLSGGFTLPFKLEAKPTCIDTERDWYDKCFTNCYLSYTPGAFRYYVPFKSCFRKCLEGKARENNQEDIKGVIHKLNFFCCGQK